jgi:hypothetical protein
VHHGFVTEQFSSEAPTALSLANLTSSLPENTSTASRVKVADIIITDDGLGTNTVTLSGTDATSFEVIGTELFLKAGTALDFETKTSYAVTISAGDPALPGSTPVSVEFTLNIDEATDPAPTNSITLTTPNQQTITFAADPGSPPPTVTSISNLDLSGLPADISLDQGLYAINYDDVPIGGSTTLTLFLPPGSNVNSYWKYGPPSQGEADQWYDFRFDPLTETGAKFQDLNGDGQNEVILHFRDGLRGDSDFTVNGRIIDPGAPAFDSSLLPVPTLPPPPPGANPPVPTLPPPSPGANLPVPTPPPPSPGTNLPVPTPPPPSPGANLPVPTPPPPSPGDKPSGANAAAPIARRKPSGANAAAPIARHKPSGANAAAPIARRKPSGANADIYSKRTKTQRTEPAKTEHYSSNG